MTHRALNLDNLAPSGARMLLLSEAHDVSCCGHKAYNLGRMLNAHLSVPPGFLVPNQVFQSFLDDNRLRTPIAALCKNISVQSTPDCLQEVARSIRELLLATQLAPAVRSQIARLRSEHLAGVSLMVRSSAVGEDSAHASFAGQLDSFSDIESDEKLVTALRACWASYWSERSLFYQIARRQTLHGMGVIIQQQVKATVAGVLFTRSPDTHSASPDEMVGEYVFGHGEQLVAGRINPGRFTISRNHHKWQRLNEPEQPDSPRDAYLFNELQISTLARVSLMLEEMFGGPQDIEWAIDSGGRLWLLQARPITVSPYVRQCVVVWSNTNVNENFPGPVSPLLYSIASAGYFHYFRNLGRAFGIAERRLQSMDYALRNIVGVHGARLYYNLTNIHAVLRAVPLGGQLTQWFNEFVGAREMPPPPSYALGFGNSGRPRSREFLEICCVVIKTIYQYSFLTRRVMSFERTVSRFGAQTVPATLATRSLPELWCSFRQFLDIRFNRWTNAALADAASMVCYGLLKRLLERAFTHADDGALHGTLLKGLPDLASSIPASKLWDLSRDVRRDPALTQAFATQTSGALWKLLQERVEFTAFHSALEHFIEQWGFRCSGELMLTVPSFQENPGALLDILKTYVGLDGQSPVDILSQQEQERVAATKRTLSDLSVSRLSQFLPFSRAWRFKRLLKWTQRSIALRERARLKQALLYSRARHIALAIGDRLVTQGYLGKREDVFFLSYLEIEAILAGSAMFPYSCMELVSLRQTAHTHLSAMIPPDVIELPEGEYLPLAPATNQWQSSYDKQSSLKGTGVCGGKVTARATVLKDVAESNQLAAGDILITTQTDPGWGPVFFLISGLVMERGGLLSHGAILAREYGIPTVVGVKEATRRIPPKATVSVDGDRGIVQISA